VTGPGGGGSGGPDHIRTGDDRKLWCKGEAANGSHYFSVVTGEMI
jgi:hypothetical protein